MIVPAFFPHPRRTGLDLRGRRWCRKDGILRAKLNEAGYKVVEITAAALNDQTTVDANFDEIAVYLDRKDLFAE